MRGAGGSSGVGLLVFLLVLAAVLLGLLVVVFRSATFPQPWRREPLDLDLY